MIKSMKSPRRLAAVAVFAIVAMSAFGFAASNSVPDSHAGDGKGDVVGGTVTLISYDVSTADPALIDGVDFSFASAVAPGTVRATLVGGGASVSCDISGLPAVSCDFSSAAAATRRVEDIVELQITSWD